MEVVIQPTADRAACLVARLVAQAIRESRFNSPEDLMSALEYSGHTVTVDAARIVMVARGATTHDLRWLLRPKAWMVGRRRP